MANFLRLTLLIIFFTLPSLSKADYPAPTRYFGNDNLVYDGGTPDEAGNLYFQALKKANPDFVTYQSAVGSGNGTYIAHACTASNYCSAFNITSGQRCPDGSFTATCTGSPPAAPAKCSSDFSSPTVRSYTLDAGVNTKALKPADIPAQSCIAGCTWQTQGSYTTFTLADGSNHIEIGTRPTGVACSLTDAQPAQPTTLTLSKQDCLSKGMSFGQVNGIDVCLKAGTSTSATVGSKTDTTSKSSVNGTPTNDEKSTDTSTVNNDNSVTTNRSTTVNNPDGTKTTKEDSKTQDKTKFCEENPNSKICLDDKKSSFVAACPQSTCEGDAVQCAIAKRQQQDACDALTSKDAITSKSSSALGDRLVDGKYSDDVQGFIDGNADSSRTIKLPNSLSEDGNASYSADGFGDVSVSVLGRNITLPISKVNEYFGYFGFVLLGLAYMTSYKIVSGAI